MEYTTHKQIFKRQSFLESQLAIAQDARLEGLYTATEYESILHELLKEIEILKTEAAILEVMEKMKKQRIDKQQLIVHLANDILKSNRLLDE